MSEVIYLVSQGSYSDYRVLAAFTEKSTAEQVVLKILADRDSYDDPFVEEVALNPDIINNRLTAFRVDMEYKTGDNALVTTCSAENSLGIDGRVDVWGRTGGKKRFTTNCWAEDAERAIKIANERRTQHKAMKGVEHE